MNKEVSVGGISISCFNSIDDVVNTAILDGEKVFPGIGIAINPEKVIAASNDDKVKEVIEKATLRYPDGIGVSYVMAKKSGQKVARIPGCELWENLMDATISSQAPVYLVGASESVITKTREKLLIKGVNVVGYQNGFFESDDAANVIHSIKKSGARIVTVALGSPKQELFIFDCIKQVPDAFYMGVGGTYDVFTGNVKRAPFLYRKLHCEWLYRLLSQPTRFRRQFNLLKYVYRYLTNKL